MGTVGGRIMKIIRERLFAAPWAVRRAEKRRVRGIVAVSAARAWAAEIEQQHAAQPRQELASGMKRTRHKRVPSVRRRALQIIAANPDGCTEAMLAALDISADV